jgi:hypothetical protein
MFFSFSTKASHLSLSWARSVHFNTPSYFLIVHFNIIFLSTSRSSNITVPIFVGGEMVPPSKGKEENRIWIYHSWMKFQTIFQISYSKVLLDIQQLEYSAKRTERRGYLPLILARAVAIHISNLEPNKYVSQDTNLTNRTM